MSHKYITVYRTVKLQGMTHADISHDISEVYHKLSRKLDIALDIPQLHYKIPYSLQDTITLLYQRILSHRQSHHLLRQT